MVDVPTIAQHDALATHSQTDHDANAARITALEHGAPVPPPLPPPAPAGTPRERVLALLASIRGKSWILSQQCHDNLAERDFDASRGINPGLLWVDPWMDNSSYYSNAGIARLAQHAAAGGLVGVSCALPNPITRGGGTDRGGVNAAQLITPGTAQNGAFLALVDQVAATIAPLDALGAHFHRAFFEADQGSFWWNVQGMFTVSQYQQLWRIYFDRLKAHGLKNLISVWATNGARVDHMPTNPLPDIIGFDAYTSDPARYGPHYDALLAAAPATPIAFAEFGSGTWSAGDPNFNCQVLVDAIRTRMPAVCFVTAWTGDINGGWSWGRYNNPAALQQTALALGGF